MIKGKLVNLRPIRKSDLKYIESWINDLEVQYFSQEEYPFYFDSNVIKKIYSEGINGRRYIFIIEDKIGNVIGELWLYPIDFYRKITELIIVIGKQEAREKGYGKDAIKTIKKYCFEKLGLEAIYLKVFSFNIRAINCYKACGFKIVGKNIKRVKRFGRLYDELIMEARKVL